MSFDKVVIDQWIELREKQKEIASANDELIEALRESELSFFDADRLLYLMQEQLEYKKFELDEYADVHNFDMCTSDLTDTEADELFNCIYFKWYTKRIEWNNKLKLLNLRLECMYQYLGLECHSIWSDLDHKRGSDRLKNGKCKCEDTDKISKMHSKLEGLYDSLYDRLDTFWEYFKDKDCEDASLDDWILRLELYKHNVSLEEFAENKTTWNGVKILLLRLGNHINEFWSMWDSAAIDERTIDGFTSFLENYIEEMDSNDKNSKPENE